jgi:hypothetical protein
MKKLVLGLLLTAGICGNAWASEGKVESKYAKLIVDCSIYAKISINDSCGNTLSTVYTVTVGSGSECDGAMMGLKFSNYSTVIPGCKPMGPVQQNAAIVQ